MDTVSEYHKRYEMEQGKGEKRFDASMLQQTLKALVFGHSKSQLH